MKSCRYIAVMFISWSCELPAQFVLRIDPTFSSGVNTTGVADIECLPEGELLIAGEFELPIWSPSRGQAKLFPDGQLDWNFDFVHGTCLKLWMGENRYYGGVGAIGLGRFHLNGAIDWSYHALAGFSAVDTYAFHVFPDGRIWRMGSYSKILYDDGGQIMGFDQGYGLLQLTSEGVVDDDFEPRKTVPGYFHSINPTPDGRFILSGRATQFGGIPCERNIRIDEDGIMDTTFTTSIYWGHIRDIYYYPDGRMLAFGLFQVPEYPSDTLSILRLMPDGATDPSWPAIKFRNPLHFFSGNAIVRRFMEMEEGKLIVTGEFAEVNGIEKGGLAVIDTSGNVLWDHFPGTGGGALYVFGDHYRGVMGIEKCSDGHIYLYGSYSTYDDGEQVHQNQRLISRVNVLHVGMEEHVSQEAFLKVWPNPSSGRITVDISGPKGRIHSIRFMMHSGGMYMHSD